MDNSLAPAEDGPRANVEALYAADPSAVALGIALRDCALGSVTISQSVTTNMLNANGIVHGGYLFMLADTAFAYCCASLGRRSVTRSAEISFIAPARAGSLLTAAAALRSSYGRNTICDVSVFADDELVAEFRGHGTVMPAV